MPRDPEMVAAEARLKTAQDRARRKAMGPLLKLADAALDQAAQVGELDIALAEVIWDRDSGLPGMLSAEVGT